VREEMTGSVNATNIFLSDPQNLTGFSQVLEELPAVGATPTASYTIGSQLISQEKGGTNSYLMADGHGSTRFLTDTNGVISDRYSYDAYGVALDFTFGTLNSPRTAMLYSGERFDSDLQQYYLRARYYNPTVGRFGAQDQQDGTPNDPLSLHKYAYCQNNPVNMHDPSGNEGELISTSFAMGIAETIEAINTIHTIWTLGKMITESVVANESLDQIEGQDAKPGVDTATIIVHGVAGHANGWSKDLNTTPFQQDLGFNADSTPKPVGKGSQPLNHDFYEFDWGGFSLDNIGLYPIKSVHTMALLHLQAAEELVSMKGYDKINIISHSWGTTLSYDLMNSTDIEVHDWVTMGSPLKWTTQKPDMNTGNWFNYYSLKDPVMHYEIYPPFPGFWDMFYAWKTDVNGGQGLSGSLIIPKANQREHDMDKNGFDEHGAYWNNTWVLTHLREDLQ
jgi:RHS repeat-associated protein